MRRKGFSIMAFPTGPLCNLHCDYCYYLDKIKYYESKAKGLLLDEAVLEEYIQQYIAASAGPVIEFSWQGGEPTLRGLEFFKKAVELQAKYLPAGWQCNNSLQTNAVLLDEEWCEFLSKNNYLVGVSLDGPQHLHDAYRKYKGGRGTFAHVVRGVELLKQYAIDFNVLCVVNNLNSQEPQEVYNFYKELGVDFMQFIPLVESGDRQRSESAVPPGDYGSFLISVFNEWVKHDFGEVFVQIFEESLRVWLGYEASLCIFSQVCGNAMVMEHNGDLYSCDHFVSPEHLLGNILEDPIEKLVNSKQQSKFGEAKRESLPQECLNCEVRFVCQGGCPKNRIVKNAQGERINYLCSDYKRFFSYIAPFMEEMKIGFETNSPQAAMEKKLLKLYHEIWSVGRNDPCPCGSGKKYKKCCVSREKA